MSSKPYPGAEVKIIEGRHRGKIGVVMNVDKSPRGDIVYDVKIDSGYPRNTIITKLVSRSLETIKQPEDEVKKLGVGRLLLITEEPKS